MSPNLKLISVLFTNVFNHICKSLQIYYIYLKLKTSRFVGLEINLLLKTLIGSFVLNTKLRNFFFFLLFFTYYNGGNVIKVPSIYKLGGTIHRGTVRSCE